MNFGVERSRAQHVINESIVLIMVNKITRMSCELDLKHKSRPLLIQSVRMEIYTCELSLQLFRK